VKGVMRVTSVSPLPIPLLRVFLLRGYDHYMHLGFPSTHPGQLSRCANAFWRRRIISGAKQMLICRGRTSSLPPSTAAQFVQVHPYANNSCIEFTSGSFLSHIFPPQIPKKEHLPPTSSQVICIVLVAASSRSAAGARTSIMPSPRR